MSKLEQIQQEILSLNSDERELISIFIKDTFTENVVADYDTVWKKELQKRLHEVQSGTVETIDTADAIAQIRKTLNK